MDLYPFARPLLRCLDPEAAHRMTIGALKLGFGGSQAKKVDDPILACHVFGLSFANPIGLAAGFDKDAEVTDAMLALGFGFVEAGTVTPRPQPGNSGKRLYRLDEDEAVINRFGFNSQGVAAFAKKLSERKRSGRGIGLVGANVGKNRDTVDAAADYAAGVEAVCGFADYLVVNLSSPNTPGLRALQARAQIEDLLLRVLEARHRSAPDPKLPPLLAKVGPDLTDDELRDIAEVAVKTGIDGLIIGNTTIDRPPHLRSPDRDAPGGLSGRPLMAPSTACLATMYRYTEGRLPIIGCGGVASGVDAYAKIRAGASLVQLYSALIFHGPKLVEHIKRDLAARLRADGFSSVAEAVGADHR
jgi:dihydroorotate dehydrogenase